MEKIIKFTNAFDKRNNDPKKDYGVHGVNIIFILKSNKGAVQFIIYTNWHLPNVQKEFDNKSPLSDMPYLFHQPIAADIGYHSYVPIYDGQTQITDKCEWLNNKPCYYDGSSLQAEKYFNILREGGDKKLWEAMCKFYEDIFDEKP